MPTHKIKTIAKLTFQVHWRQNQGLVAIEVEKVKINDNST